MPGKPGDNAMVLEALEHVGSGFVVGLGTGRAATAFLHALAARVAQGLAVRAVATSAATARVAAAQKIPLVSLDEVDSIDVAVDGADEVDPSGRLIKGYGGALVREKIVAGAARTLVILIGEEKLVSVLGSRGRLPVEIVPFARPTVVRALERLGFKTDLRIHEGRPYISDNGNEILDVRLGPIASPDALEHDLRGIPGVVGTGLFLGFRPVVIVNRV